MTKFDVHLTSPTLAGITWQERYNCYTTKIAGWLNMSFSYSDGGYKIFVAGACLKARGTYPEDAAKIAIAAAKKLMAEALKKLEV